MEGLLETLDCLSNSPQRLQVLRSLTDRPKSFSELRSELESPRTTLKRNLSILEEHDWVSEDRAGYAVTTTGSLLLRELQLLGERVERIHALEPFLAAVDDPDQIDTGSLRDSRVTVPEPNRPYLPSNRLFDALEARSYELALAPVLSARFLSWFVDSTTPIECVAPAETVERVNDRRDEPVSVAVEDGELLTFDGDLPYGLFASDDHVALVAYDETGRIEALVESESNEAIEWSERVYDSYRRDATPARTQCVAGQARGGVN